LQFRAYLESYARRHLELLEEARPETGDYPATVASTWSLSFQEIEKESPASADMLRVLAFLAPDAIPLEIFEEGTVELGEPLAEAMGDGDPLALSELLAPLQRFSLVESDMEARTVSIHRMVQAAARTGLDERSWAERVVKVLKSAYPESPEFKDWLLCERLEPHVRKMERLVGRHSIEIEAAAELFYSAIDYAMQRGRLVDAESFIKRSITIQEKLHGIAHISKARLLHSLARVLHAQGDLDGARENLERSLEIKASVFGTQEHPSVAASLHSLAGVLQAQGDLDGARKNLERVLEIDAGIYGTRDHYSTAMTEEQLGRLLEELAEPEIAQELLEHAYQVYLNQLGPEHPYTGRLGGRLGKHS
jgi:tetratricopeptide (TPR) repeat protein